MQQDVQPTQQAQDAKKKPRRYNPVKTGWIVSCIAVVVALGLFYCSVQAQWVRAAIETPKISGPDG